MMKSLLSLLWLIPFLAYADPEPTPKADSKPAHAPPPTLHTQRHAVWKQIQDHLLHSEFDDLTKMAQQFRTGKEKFTDGNWKLDCFYSAFSAAKPEDWPPLLDKLEEWNKRETKDPAPVIAIGYAYWSYGKQARGGGYADTVTEEGWKLMGERLKIALSRLIPQTERCKTCPGFYGVLLTIGIDASMDHNTFENIFLQGTKLEPTYVTLYETKAYYLLPRWYGKQGDVAQFVQDTLKTNPEAALWVLYRLQYQGVEKDIFQAESIDWDSTKAGLKTCLGPDLKGAAQANMLAYLADVEGDKETVADALRPVHFMIDPSIWRSQARWKEIQAAFKSGAMK